MRSIARRHIIMAILITAAMGVFPAARAAGFNPATKQAQSKLATLGFNPGTADGILGPRTITAIKEFQKKSGLPETGILDSATLAKLDTVAQPSQAQAAPQTPPAAQSTTVSDWRAVPTQDELDKLTAKVNDPGCAIHRLPAERTGGQSRSARRGDRGRYENQLGYFWERSARDSQIPRRKPTNAMTDLSQYHGRRTGPDITIHYYCQMANPRQCFTYALRGQSTPGGKKYSRTEAYKGCATGTVPYVALLCVCDQNTAANISICDVWPNQCIQA